MDKATLLYERKELSKAMSLAVWGMVGCIVPLLGLIFGIIAFTKASQADSGKSRFIAKRRHKVRTAAVIAIVLSGIFMVLYSAGYYFVYQNTQEQLRIEAREAANGQELKRAQETDKLNYCLDEAYKSYKAAWDADVTYLGRADGRLPDDYAQGHETRYADAKEECYRRSADGTLPAAPILLDTSAQ